MIMMHNTCYCKLAGTNKLAQTFIIQPGHSKFGYWGVFGGWNYHINWWWWYWILELNKFLFIIYTTIFLFILAWKYLMQFKRTIPVEKLILDNWVYCIFWKSILLHILLKKCVFIKNLIVPVVPLSVGIYEKFAKPAEKAGEEFAALSDQHQICLFHRYFDSW